jgi:hypothetical protein
MRIRKEFRIPKFTIDISSYSQEWFRQDDIQYLAEKGTFVNYNIYTKADTYEEVVAFEFEISPEHVTFYNIKYGTK